MIDKRQAWRTLLLTTTTHLGREKRIDLAHQRHQCRASKLVRAAVPFHVEHGVEFVGDLGDRRGDDGAVEHDEEVDEGDRQDD